MVGSEVAKVICQTCYTEHAFRHGDAGKKKSDPRTLFDQVLGKASPSDPKSEQAETPTPEKATSRTTSRLKSKSPRGKVK
jgi:hypothetical protein